MGAAETTSHGMDEAGAECVAFIENRGRPCGVRIEREVVESVGLQEVCVVIIVSAKQTAVAPSLRSARANVDLTAVSAEPAVEKLNQS